MKIGPVHHEVALLMLKKEQEVNTSKIYSVIRKFAKTTKIQV